MRTMFHSTSKEKRSIVFLSILGILMSSIIMVQQLYIMGLKSVLTDKAGFVYFFDPSEKEKNSKVKDFLHARMVESSNRCANATFLEKMLIPEKETAEFSRIRYERFLRFCTRQQGVGKDEQ